MSRLATLLFNLFALAAMLIPGPAVAQGLVNQVVAVVEKDVITLAEVDGRIWNQVDQLEKRYSGDELKKKITELRSKALDAMINDRVAEAEARSMGIKVSDAEVDATVEQILKGNNIDRDQLERSLAMDGLTWDSYRKTLRRQLLQSKLVYTALKPKIIIPEDKKRALYEDRAEEFKGSEEVVLRRIVLGKDQGQLAESLVADLAKGADFGKLAEEFSIAPDGANGGLLGGFEVDQLSKTLQKALSTMKAGQSTPVIETRGALQIFQLLERKVDPGKSFEQVKDQLTEELIREAVAGKFDEWVKEVRKRRFVKLMPIVD